MPSVSWAMKGRLVAIVVFVAAGCKTPVRAGCREPVSDALHRRLPAWCAGVGSNASSVGGCAHDELHATTSREFVVLHDRASAVIDAVATWNAAERASAGMVRMLDRAHERVTVESAWLTTPTTRSENTRRARRR